ncbi:unnamed protein product [Mycena citricolor]|uniref:Carboxylesterase type B domain-containing protein n=1 Tax=Mycena citricolor TaxID=2018698 RepID=A0AAD2H4W3_9AGAR|nr:unnamed protein product [Mycena citricolor]
MFSRLSFVCALAAAAAVGASQPAVTIQNGTVRGVTLPELNQNLFLGIPYAQPPVGELRLRPPRSINASFGTLDATAYGPHCWSAFTTGFDDNSGFQNSEDCLTLNVIQPTNVTQKGPFPVDVWIHGGGLFTGGSADFRYNGSYLVQASIANGAPIVFVSINYRLASFGFLAGKQLADEGSLNLGVRDQRLALHWVQENIAKFNGNPKKVTIHGQSAGSNSVHTQIVAYGGRDDKLFTQAIPQSGSGSRFPQPTDAGLQATFTALLGNTTCASTLNGTAAAQLACVRGLPVDAFRNHSVGTTGIVRDGDFIQTPSVYQSYKTGKWVKVAFLTGSNTDEGRSFARLGANTTADAYNNLTVVPAQFRSRLLELYPDNPELGSPFNTGPFELDPVQNGLFATPGTQNKRVSAIVGDVMEYAGPRFVGQTVAHQVPFYKYRFNHIPYSVSFSVEDFVGHFVEVAYSFNSQNNDTAFWVQNHFTATYLGPGAPVADRFLGFYMSRSWAAFIATGDPNNAKVTSKIAWPKYSEGGQQLVWQTQGSALEKDNFRAEAMDYIIDNVLLGDY